jgi:hypothetical protein
MLNFYWFLRTGMRIIRFFFNKLLRTIITVIIHFLVLKLMDNKINKNKLINIEIEEYNLLIRVLFN